MGNFGFVKLFTALVRSGVGCATTCATPSVAALLLKSINLKYLTQKLDITSVQATLDRGYAIVKNNNNKNTNNILGKYKNYDVFSDSEIMIDNLKLLDKIRLLSSLIPASVTLFSCISC